MSSDVQIPTSQVVEPNDNTQAATTNGKDEIAHVLFLDVVGFTKLRPAKQTFVLSKLQNIVRASEDYGTSKQKGQLIALPTGDGMALVFLTTVGGSGPAASCAEKIAESIKQYNRDTSDEAARINVRMGIHSGNVVRVSDVNDRANVAGDGINTAQRVMDCGDIGHILLSDLAYRLLPADPDRSDRCVSLGKVKVKHDHEVRVYNLVYQEIGNQETPQKVRLQKEQALLLEKAKAEIQKAAMRRRLLWAAGLVVAVILGGVVWWATRTPPAPPTFAVLPFTAGTQKNSSRAISKGLTEQFILSFKHLTNIKPKPLSAVRSTLSQDFPSQGESPSPLEAGKKLNVRYVLTGSAESASNDVNLDNVSAGTQDFSVDVTAALYDTEAGAQVWERKYQTNTFSELMTLQKTIVKELAHKMGAEMQVREDDTVEADAKKSSAHWSYMQGRFWATERPNAEIQKLRAEDITKKAIRNYEEAIKTDPSYARAHAGLTDVYASISGVSMDPKLAKESAAKTAAAAEIYGANQAEVYASIGTEKWWLERNFDAARMAFLLSIKLDDQFSDSHKKYSSCLTAMGRHKEAKEQIQRAMSMEPESPLIKLTSAQNHFFASEYDTAIKRLREMISSNPKIKMSGAYRFLAMALEQENRDQEALDELNAGKFESEDPDFLATRGHIFAHMKRFDEARKDVQTLERLKKENKSYVSSYDIALIYAAMPDGEGAALKWLKTAIDEFDPRVTWLKVDPRFNELRKSKQPEFDERLQWAGLAS